MSAGETEMKQTSKEDGTDKEASGETTASAVGNLRNEMMKNPSVLAALQHKLDDIVGGSSGYFEALPAAVKARVNALRNLQLKLIKLESQFFQDVHELEHKYALQYEPINEMRKKIITAEYEPTEEECVWEYAEENDEEDEENKDSKADSAENKDSKTDSAENKSEKLTEAATLDEPVTGVPSFWLTVLKSCPVVQDMLQDHDEPILQHLIDIKCNISKPGEEMSFTLEFHFKENEFFSDTILTKNYKLSDPDDETPLHYDGPEIESSTGCQINWKEGKNVTVKVVKKKQIHKNKGTVRTVMKETHQDSFFNFFNPPQVPEDEEEELDEETEALLTSDIEIGNLIRQKVVPRAVLFFTGEASEDGDYDSRDEYSFDEGDSEDDEDYDPSKAEGSPTAAATPQECNQQ